MNIYISIIIFNLLLSLSTIGQTGVINTIIGNDTAGCVGEGISATTAQLTGCTWVTVDTIGNIYVSDIICHTIRKVNTAGIITTFAGNGTAGFSGDSSAATLAELNQPVGMAIDKYGNLYFADYLVNRIRKINTSGIITTIAGDGTAIDFGDGGPASASKVYGPLGIALDTFGNLYFTEIGGQRVRKISTTGIITTVAGTGIHGYAGDGHHADSAEFYRPAGIVVDVYGNIYVADQLNNRVRKINTAGLIITIAGDGSSTSSGDGMAATAAGLNGPDGIALDKMGNLYISDNGTRIRLVNTAGIISNIAGSASLLYGFSGDGGPATAALMEVTGIALDKHGNLFECDSSQRIRKITHPYTLNLDRTETQIEKFTIFPNPAKNKLTISCGEIINSIEVYNVVGSSFDNLRMTKLDNNSKIEINIGDLAKGIYIIRVNGSIVRRFIKE